MYNLKKISKAKGLYSKKADKTDKSLARRKQGNVRKDIYYQYQE